MNKDIMKNKDSVFESIKQINEFGSEVWYAREFSKVLEYKDFRNFIKVLEKAKISCESSGEDILDHVVEVNEMVDIGSGAKRAMPSFLLSRYACYLIVQNGDPKKPIISNGQTYFAIQTRKQELREQFEELSEDRKRVAIRQELREHNKQLADAAKDAGVEAGRDYAVF